jgi:hypothetical protein
MSRLTDCHLWPKPRVFRDYRIPWHQSHRGKTINFPYNCFIEATCPVYSFLTTVFRDKL